MSSAPVVAAPARGPDPEESVDALLRDLGAGLDGLDAREAERRLGQYGPNEIRRPERQSHARQFVDPLALLLWMAVGFSLLEGTVSIALTIVAVIVLNAGFSSVQELHAERATEALRAYLQQRVRVRREGDGAEVDAGELVPGGIVLISEGDRLSDARLLDGSVELDMSPLTGESLPVGHSVERTSRVSAVPNCSRVSARRSSSSSAVLPRPSSDSHSLRRPRSPRRWETRNAHAPVTRCRLERLSHQYADPPNTIEASQEKSTPSVAREIGP